SPSSSASRISASAVFRCSSVSLPCPRRFLNVRCSFSVRFSNMVRANASRVRSSRIAGLERPCVSSNSAPSIIYGENDRELPTFGRRKHFTLLFLLLVPTASASGPALDCLFPAVKLKLLFDAVRLQVFMHRGD